MSLFDTSAAAQGREPAHPTVLLLHCSASSGAQWYSLRACLEPRFAVNTPDLYGYGVASPWAGAVPLSLAAEAAAIAALIERAGAPVHLVGHSYGGAVALRLALDHPMRLRSLTLIEPVAFHLLRHGEAHDQALFGEITRLAAAIAEAVAAGQSGAGMSRFFDYWNGVGAWARLTPEKQSALARHAEKVGIDFWAATTESARRAAYRAIRLPTLILRGAQSPRVTRRIAELLADTLPAAELLTVADAGHMLPLTHADAVNRAVLRHLERRGGPIARTFPDTPTRTSTKEMAR
jgi:pimeloyl-ACP methyl ester carboxylesterase